MRFSITVFLQREKSDKLPFSSSLLGISPETKGNLLWNDLYRLTYLNS
jgi:hypothetical protein